MDTRSDKPESRKPRTPVLFVDDDPMAHVLMRNHLKGWNVESAYSAEQALDILNKRHILIVITDIGMPGMDGIEFLREIRKKRGIIQVIIATASDKTDDLINAFEAGATDFLLKPFKKDEIEEALESILVKLNRWRATMKVLFGRRRKADPEDIIPFDEKADPEDIIPFDEKADPEDIIPFDEKADPEDIIPFDEKAPEDIIPFDEKAPEDIIPFDEDEQ
ncbi:response regulator [Desulfococcaceae bacterium HSG8]|nr:response regulator [Desulfococcaceae bacterium HSG8]